MADEAQLIGSWLHSHEEDADGVQVFRPIGYPFPPSRGRDGFTLDADGSAVLGAPGPDDRGRTAGGRWHLDGSTLNLQLATRRASYRVLSVDRSTLSLRPQTDR
jgi:hypothetical protein